MRMLEADGVKVYEVEREGAWKVVWPFMGGGWEEVSGEDVVAVAAGRRLEAPVGWQGRGRVG